MSRLTLFVVGTNISDQRNFGPLCSRRPTPAVLDRHALARLDANVFASVKVDGRVWFAGGFLEGSCLIYLGQYSGTSV